MFSINRLNFFIGQENPFVNNIVQSEINSAALDALDPGIAEDQIDTCPTAMDDFSSTLLPSDQLESLLELYNVSDKVQAFSDQVLSELPAFRPQELTMSPSMSDLDGQHWPQELSEEADRLFMDMAPQSNEQENDAPLLDKQKTNIYPLVCRRKSVKWTPEADNKLKELVEELGPKWTEIAKRVSHGKTNMQCRNRYELISKSLSPWAPETDNKLKELFEELGPKWVEIATKISHGKTNVQCRKRYELISKQTSSYHSPQEHISGKQALNINNFPPLVLPSNQLIFERSSRLTNPFEIMEANDLRAQLNQGNNELSKSLDSEFGSMLQNGPNLVLPELDDWQQPPLPNTNSLKKRHGKLIENPQPKKNKTDNFSWLG